MGLNYFENLAGVENSSNKLKNELELGGIDIRSDFSDSMYKNTELVKPKFWGNIEINNPRNSWAFIRMWRYWVAEGYTGIPYEYALKLYKANEVDDIRVFGGGGHPKQAHGFGINSYHIDTFEGLKILADIIKEIKNKFKVL